MVILDCTVGSHSEGEGPGGLTVADPERGAEGGNKGSGMKMQMRGQI